MLPYVIQGAEFDSSDRDPPPRCLPGTNQELMNIILAWRHNENRTERLLWLNGSARVGKSAIIQTLAEAEAEGAGKLGATFFFSRRDGRDDLNGVLATIAYRLAAKDSTYQAYIAGRVAEDPLLFEKIVSAQFKLFITQPFGEKMLCNGPDSWSIYLDGLDECHDEAAQCQLVELISSFTLRYPKAPLVWIIASRRKSHLQALFARDDIASSCYPITIPTNSHEARQDAEQDLRTRRNNSDTHSEDQCLECGGVGHWALDCPSFRCLGCNRTAPGHYAYDCRQYRCPHCGVFQPGHRAKYCDQNPRNDP